MLELVVMSLWWSSKCLEPHGCSSMAWSAKCLQQFQGTNLLCWARREKCACNWPDCWASSTSKSRSP
eukprot:8694460-Karenia_brevis.AAC.1